MPPKRDPVPRVRSAPQWLGGLFVLGLIGAAVVGGGAILWENVDVQRMTASVALRELHSPPPALLPKLPARSDSSFEAAIYFSSASDEFFSDSTYYSSLLESWDSLARDAGATVTTIAGAEAIDSMSSSELLIAPSAVCLTAREISAMRGFAERGGGLVLTWATGARDSTCNWMGWDGLSEITEGSEFNVLDRRDAVYLTVPARLPLSAGFDPAKRVEFRFESQLSMATTGPRIYWSDWSLNAQPAEDEVGVDAAAWMGRTDAGGRIVWYGFRHGQGASERDEEQIARLFKNGVWWAAGVPVVEVSPWPDGTHAAFLLTQDAESHFANSVGLARVARQKAIPATFFVVSQVAMTFPEIADTLAGVVEIGSHTSDHAVLSGRSYVDQRARLSRSQNEVRSWAGTPALGLRPPEERFDEATLRAWTWTGGRYLIAANEARSGSPEVFDTPDGRVVVLPRIIKNDFNVYVQDGAMRSRRMTEAFLEGMAKVNALGAIAVISVRTQVGGEGNRVLAVAEVVDSARAQGNWWFAAGTEAAQWWLSRWETNVQVGSTSENGLVVDVRSGASYPLNGAWIELYLPGEPEDWTPRQNGTLVRHLRTEWGLQIPLGDLDQDSEARIVLESASQ